MQREGPTRCHCHPIPATAAGGGLRAQENGAFRGVTPYGGSAVGTAPPAPPGEAAALCIPREGWGGVGSRGEGALRRPWPRPPPRPLPAAPRSLGWGSGPAQGHGAAQGRCIRPRGVRGDPVLPPPE